MYVIRTYIVRRGSATLGTVSDRAERSPLTRDRVLDGAIAFADQHGLPALSMRKLASSLGFEVMALYNHVKNKPDLIRGMTDRIADEVVEPEGRPCPKAALREHAVSLRAVLEAHPWAAMCWVTTLPGPNRWRLMEWELQTVAAIDGLTDEQAHHAFHAVTNHVVGYVLQNAVMPFDRADLDEIADSIRAELDPIEHRHVLRHIGQHQEGEHGESFEHVLDLILDGLVPSPTALR